LVKRHGSSDPDPHKNVTDPQHCYFYNLLSDGCSFVTFRRCHMIATMKEYREQHGDPERVLRHHQCQICFRLIKWEASRIRDHLKLAHKDPDDRLSLGQYAARFSEFIVSELRKFKFREVSLSAPDEDPNGPTLTIKNQEAVLQCGGYSREKWRELFKRKYNSKDRVACPYCNGEFNRSSLNKHIDRFHIGREGCRRKLEHVTRVDVGTAETLVGTSEEITCRKTEPVSGLHITKLPPRVIAQGQVGRSHSSGPEERKGETGGERSASRASCPTYVVDQETGEILVVDSVEEFHLIEAVMEGEENMEQEEEEQTQLEFMEMELVEEEERDEEEEEGEIEEVEREEARDLVEWDPLLGEREHVPSPRQDCASRVMVETCDIREMSGEDIGITEEEASDIGENSNIEDELDDDSQASEYEEGPLDGKIMQIYLPDVVTPGEPVQGEDEVSVKIVKLDSFRERAESEDEENSVGVPETEILDDMPTCPFPVLFAEAGGNGSDSSMHVRGSVIVLKREIGDFTAAESTAGQFCVGSGQMLNGDSSLICHLEEGEQEKEEGEQEEEVGEHMEEVREHMEEEQEEVEQEEEVGEQMEEVGEQKEEEQEDGEQQEEEQEEGEQQEELQILEIVTGEHGGVQQITVVANKLASGAANKHVISDQIRQLFTSWGSVHPPEAGETSLTTDVPKATLLKLLELQVDDVSPAINSEPARIVLQSEKDNLKMAAVDHENPQLLRPATKAAALAALNSYTKKQISKSMAHPATGRVSTGTQASSWTKMAAERVKVARNKLIVPRVLPPADTDPDSSGPAAKVGGHFGAEENISSISQTLSDLQRRSIGTQVRTENFQLIFLKV
jgi:hypothetical protein